MNKKSVLFAFDSVFGVILSALLGIVLLIWPELSSKYICYGLGLGLLIFGVFRIIRYFFSNTTDAMLRRDLSTGILLLGVSFILLLSPELVISLLPALMGLLLIMGAARGIQTALDLRRMSQKRWLTILIIALVLAVLGVLIILNPFSTALVLMRFVGATIIFESIALVVFMVALSKQQKDYSPNDK